jgi:phosphate uptake regulator
MKRKLVKQGAATMMISLPSKWIKNNHLEKGDEIELEEKDNELLITTDQIKKEKKEILININKDNEHDIKVILSHAYRRGFDRITLEGITKEHLSIIREATEKLLLGFEITEKSSNRCVIENISEPKEGKYEVMLKKVFLITKEQHKTILEDFKKNKFDNMKEMEETRYQQDRLILFCRRLIAKENLENAILEWELLTFLMHINHSYYYLYKYANENKSKSDKNILELLNDLEQYFDLFEDAYYNKNIDSIHKINNLKNRHHFGKCLKLIEKSDNPVVHSYIKEIFRLIQVGTSPIIGLIFEKKD